MYTLNGCQPGWAIHLYCPGKDPSTPSCVLILFDLTACHHNYHHNYYVSGGQRTYYSGIPSFLQVSEHRFVERQLAEMWTNQHLLGSYVFRVLCMRQQADCPSVVQQPTVVQSS